MGVGVVVEPGASSRAARDVDVRQAVEREPVEHGHRVVAVVAGVGVEVGHVEQQQGAGALEQLGDEVALVELGFRPLDQGGDGLEGQGDGQAAMATG